MRGRRKSKFQILNTMPKTTPKTTTEPTVKKPSVLPDIHLAMAAISADIEAIAKDRDNQQQGFKFRGIDDVYNNLHHIFAAHGVTCVPVIEKLETTSHINSKGNQVFRSFVTAGYRFTSSDGSFVEAKTVGEGSDFADKATAKALSAAHKYLLIQTFLIPTKDIADGDIESTIDPRQEIEARREFNENVNVQIAEKIERQGSPEVSEEERQRLHDEALALEKRKKDVPAEEKPEPPKAQPKTEAEKTEEKDDWFSSHVITKEMINHKFFEGKVIGELDDKSLLKAVKHWALKESLKSQIDASPIKTKCRDALKLEFNKRGLTKKDLESAA